MSELSARTSPGLHDGPLVALLLHGYGSSEDDLAGLAPHVVPGLPRASLRAPLVCKQRRVHQTRADSPEVAAIWRFPDVRRDSSSEVVVLSPESGVLTTTSEDGPEKDHATPGMATTSGVA